MKALPPIENMPDFFPNDESQQANTSAVRIVLLGASPGQVVDWLPDALDGDYQALLDDVNAHEGTLWWRGVAEGGLVPVLNTGPNAGQLVLHYCQPFVKGIISMVYHHQHAYIEQRLENVDFHDTTLNDSLGREIIGMMAIPAVFAGSVQGVWTAVQMADQAELPTFTLTDLEVFQTGTQRLAQALSSHIQQETGEPADG